MTEIYQENTFTEVVGSLSESKNRDELIRKLVFDKPSRPRDAVESAKALHWIFRDNNTPVMIRAFSGVAAAHTLMNACDYKAALETIDDTDSLIRDNFNSMTLNYDRIRENRIHLLFSVQAVAWQVRLILGEVSRAKDGLAESVRFFENTPDSDFDGKYFFQTSNNVFRVLGASSALAYKSGDWQSIDKNSILINKELDFALSAQWDHPVIRNEFEGALKIVVFHRELAQHLHLDPKNVLVESLSNLLFSHSKRTRGVNGGPDEAGKEIKRVWSQLGSSTSLTDKHNTGH